MSGPEWYSYDKESEYNDHAICADALAEAREYLESATKDWWRSDEEVAASLSTRAREALADSGGDALRMVTEMRRQRELYVDYIRAGIALWRPRLVDIPEEERQPSPGPVQRWVMELDADAVAAVLAHATLPQLEAELKRRITGADVEG